MEERNAKKFSVSHDEFTEVIGFLLENEYKPAEILVHPSSWYYLAYPDLFLEWKELLEMAQEQENRNQGAMDDEAGNTREAGTHAGEAGADGG